jgi:hypothetical protein
LFSDISALGRYKVSDTLGFGSRTLTKKYTTGATTLMKKNKERKTRTNGSSIASNSEASQETLTGG